MTSHTDFIRECVLSLLTCQFYLSFSFFLLCFGFMCLCLIRTRKKILKRVFNLFNTFFLVEY